MRMLVGVALAAGLACAQTFQIRGTVTDPDLKLGIAGVDVTLFEAATSNRATVTTGAGGAFQFRPERAGIYSIDAKREGYTSGVSGGARLDSGVATLSPQNPLQELKLFLTRPGEVTGRVADADDKPVADFRVQVRQAGPLVKLNGLAFAVQQSATGSASPLTVAGEAVTDKDGFFTSKKLPPGDYLVRVARPWSSNKGNVTAKLSEEDTKAVDEDFEEASIPVHVVPGSTVDAGKIELSRRASYYRARVRVRTDECDPGEKWTFTAFRADDNFFGVANLDCTGEFLVRNLKPGSYEFQLSSEHKAVSMPVEIARGNVDVDLTLNRALDLTGRVVAAKDAALPPIENLKIMVIGGRMGTLNADGTFLVTNVMWNGHTVFVNGLPPQDYLKEVRYNGVALPGRIFLLSAGFTQQLEIVIDDKAAALSGAVTEADQPVPGARMIAVKWPAPPGDEVPDLPSASADAAGHFHIAGLAPGEYRVLAVLPGTNFNSNSVVPIVSNADKVTLDPGGSQNLTMKLTRP